MSGDPYDWLRETLSLVSDCDDRNSASAQAVRKRMRTLSANHTDQTADNAESTSAPFEMRSVLIPGVDTIISPY